MAVVLTALILPATAALIPRFSTNDTKSQTNTYATPPNTLLYLNTPSGDFPYEIEIGEPFQVSGYLYAIDWEKFTKYFGHIASGESFDEEFRNNIKPFLDKGILQPFSGQIITVSTEDSSITYSYNKTNINGDDTKNVYSDQSGYFQATILIDNIRQWHEWIVGTYAGETASTASDGSTLPIPVTYSPASDKIPRPSESGDLAGGFIGSPSVITAGLIGCAVLFLAVIAFIAFYYRKQIRALLKRRNKQAVPAEEISTPLLIIPAITTGDQHVEITFPQIENPLPPVWGIREPLLIASHALIDKPENGMNSTPQIQVKDNAINIVMLDYSPIQVAHIFVQKGEIVITVHFGTNGNGEMIGNRKIRIVDYREETVAVFNHLIDFLTAKGFKVNRLMTAREIESKLKEQNPDLSPDFIQDIVNSFESANYSLHPVARQIYTDMYLAVEKIRERLNHA
jgi:hypothetical protein